MKSTRLQIAACACVFSFVATAAHAREFPATRPYKPVVYQHVEETDPPQRIYVVAIDLTNRDAKIRVAPGGPDPDGEGKWQTILQRPTEIAEREGFEVTVNGDFFSVTRAPDAPKEQKGYVIDMWASVTGAAMTDGKAWSQVEGGKPRPCLIIDGQGQPKISRVAAAPDDAKQAISGSDVVVEGGKDVAPATKGFAMTRHPRTAVGIADGGKRLVLVVVDGRKKDASGMTLPELAQLMLKLDCESALNLDGGGSR